jgi:AcrR family transcriptional regulator
VAGVVKRRADWVGGSFHNGAGWRVVAGVVAAPRRGPRIGRVVRQELLEQRRQQILGAALKVFAELGYHNAGIADIAREVGAGHGTFYRYFENKRDILDHVLTYAAERITAALAVAGPPVSNSLPEYRAQVERIGNALFTLFVEDRQLAPVFFMQSMSVDAEMTDRILALHDAMAAVTESYLRNGVDKGFLRADLDVGVTARAVNGTITAGAIAALRFEDPPAERDRWVRGVTTLMFDGVAAR